MTHITDTQIAMINAATNGALYDAECGWFSGEPVHTAETLAQFEAAVNNYNESTLPTRGTIAGFPYVAYRTVQPRRHDTRHSLSVIDLGDVRIAIRENLADYLLRDYTYRTDRGSGTIEAPSFEAACARLDALVPASAIADGGWGWVDDCDDEQPRYEVGGWR